MRGQARALAGAWLLSLVPARPALAEEEPEVTLPEQVVRLPRTAPQDPTGAATVVDATRFAGEAKDVAALVATAPGVAIQEYGGLGQLTTVSIRGSTASGVKVLLDGLPLNTAAGGAVDLSTIPRAWVDRIEVIRGAEGARYGQGALGGVVNVLTGSPAAGGWSAQATGGSFSTGSLAADAAAGAASWGVLLAGGLDGSGGRFPYRFDPLPSVGGNSLESRVRSNDSSLAGGLLAKGWLRAGEGRIDLLGQLSGGTRGLPGSPYALTPDDWQRESRGALAARWTVPLGGASMALGADGRAEGLDVRLASLGGDTVRQRDLAGAARAELGWAQGPHRLAAGARAGAEVLDATGIGIRSRPELALWASDEWALRGGRARLAPAARIESAGRFAGISAKLGASAAIAGPLSVRASAARTFRAPSFAELHLQQGVVEPNPDLRPETALSADAGLVAEGSLGLASLTAFASRYDDLVVYLPASFRRMKPFNDARAAATGLEAEAALAPLGPLRLSAQAAFTFLASETLRGDAAEVGRDLPHRPRQRLFARVGVAPGPVELHAEAHFLGRQFLDTRSISEVPAALTFHAGASVRVSSRPDVRLHLEAKNLADDRTLQDGFGNPLPGRMVLLGLRASGRGPRDGDER